jgi:DNA-binding response OmpR family regulator
MPRLDGLGLVCAIRSDPAVSSVAILFVSARTQEDERVAGLELGDDYLTKPFGSAELLARASRLMRIGAAEPVTATRPAHETAFLDALGQAVAVGLSNPDFTVVALARRLAMSERTLQDRMKALDLPPPRSWLLEARLREARALLRVGQLRTVSEVAAALGLSRACFTRACTWAGHSPTHDAAGAPAEA